MSTMVYSFHTFIYAFRIQGGKPAVNPVFEREDTISYAQRRFFYPHALEAIFNSDKNLVTVWNYKDIHDFTYNIFLPESDAPDYVPDYVLELTKIRLKLYNNNIGLLEFRLSNEKYTAPDDINKINDYGRRLFAPYISNEGCGSCAKRIEIKEGENTLYVCDPVGDGEKYSNQFINSILWGTDSQLDAEPVIDDRMFVCCYYRNDIFFWNAIKPVNGEYSYCCLDKAADVLYQFLYVDGDGLTCHSDKMKEKLLRDNIYDRWAGKPYDGSVFGFSEYSFMCFTQSDFNGPKVTDNFHNDYVEMMELVLAQRASLVILKERVSEAASSGEVEDAKKLHTGYILFKSQFLLSEVSPEQQPIEMYRYMQRANNIRESSDEVGQQIQQLYELFQYIESERIEEKEKAQKERQDKIDWRITVIGLIIAAFGILQSVDVLLHWFGVIR